MITVKKPLTAETAEKKILRILGELCVLCGRTQHLFTQVVFGVREFLPRFASVTNVRER